MIWLLGNWRLLTASLAALAVVGYVGWSQVEIATLRGVQARLSADLATEQAKVSICTGNLAATIKDKLTDDVAKNLTASELRRALSEWVSDNPDGGH